MATAEPSSESKETDTKGASEQTEVSNEPKPFYRLQHGATCPKIFVGGLNWDSTPESVKKHFSEWGVVVDVMLPRDRESGRSRGFGFVTFDCIESADKTIGGSHTLDGRTLNISPAVAEAATENNSMTEPTKRLFVGDLLSSATDQDLRNAFEGFGKLEDAVIMKTPETLESRGFGFVTFESVDSASKALKAGSEGLKVGGSYANVTKAQPKANGKGNIGGKGSKGGKGFYGKGKGKGGYYDDGYGGGLGKGGGYGKGFGGKGGYYDDGYGGKGGMYHQQGGKGYGGMMPSYDQSWGGGKGGKGYGGGKGYDMYDPGYGGKGVGKGKGYVSYDQGSYDRNQPVAPLSPLASIEPVLPEGWQAARDDQGRQYFFHHPTKTSQWEMPKGQPLPPMEPPSAPISYPGHGGGHGGEYRTDQRFNNRPRPY